MIYLLLNNKIGAEERALPALGRITPIDFNKINEEEFEHQKPDHTEPSNITLKVDKKFSAYYDKISTILGDELAKKVWADKWYFQQDGIDQTIQNLKTIMASISESDKTFIIGIVSDTIKKHQM